MIRDQGVEAYEGSVHSVRAAPETWVGRAVVASSSNYCEVPIAAGIEDTFEQRVDGRIAEREHPKGKRASDTSLPGARALGAPTA